MLQKLDEMSFEEILKSTLLVAGIFIITFVGLYIFGLVPDELVSSRISFDSLVSNNSSNNNDQNNDNYQNFAYLNNNSEDINNNSNENTGSEQALATRTVPTRITVPKVGIDSEIIHPQSAEISVLDEALKEGAVYYPGSGTIENGNIFLFGHSSGLPVVRNQAYKTFNGIKDLKQGDKIYLYSGNEQFVYEVQSLTLVDESRAFVDFTKEGSKLTISTCNSFGQKIDGLWKQSWWGSSYLLAFSV